MTGSATKALFRLTSTAAVLATLTAAADPAPPPAPLAAKGPWTVHYEDDLCLMERRFMVGDTELMLAFQPLLDLPTVEISVIGPDANTRLAVGKFIADLAASGQHFTGEYFSAMSNTKPGTRVTRLTIERAALEGLRDGDVLHIQAKPIDLSFAIAKPDKAIAALAACSLDLKRAWGVPLDQPAHPVETAINLWEYFSPDVYPHEALSQGISGRVVTLLNISAVGKVSACRVLSSAGVVLNAGTCKVARTIRFKPARDAANTPIASTYVMPVRWVLGR